MKCNTKYKDTKIGKIPEEWIIYEISDVAEVIGGGTPSTKVPEYWDGDISWITPKDLSNFKFRYIKGGVRNITKKGLDASSVKILPKNTVLLTTRAPVGYLAIADNEVTTNQGFRSLVPKRKTNSEFLFYLLKNNVAVLKANATGTTFGELSGSALKSLKFAFPPVEEQEAITKILSDLDLKIELNCQINKNLEEIAQAIFKQWFVDFEFPNENGEPYKSSGGEMIDSELGTIPKICKVIMFEKIIEISSGKRPKEMKNRKNKEFIFPIIGASSVMGYTSDILYTKPILIIGRVGTHGVVQRINENSWPSDNTLVIQSEYYEYGYQVLKNIDYKSLNRGSTQPLIIQTDIKKYKIIFPKQKMLLKDFEKKIGSLFKLINKNKEENKILSRIRDVLLPKLMSGKIRVPINSKLINQNN
jgi:type I restriction enzyme, S subunit